MTKSTELLLEMLLIISPMEYLYIYTRYRLLTGDSTFNYANSVPELIDIHVKFRKCECGRFIHKSEGLRKSGSIRKSGGLR